MSASRSSAERSTSAPAAKCGAEVNSAGVWERPFAEGTNTIPIGQREAIRQAS